MRARLRGAAADGTGPTRGGADKSELARPRTVRESLSNVCTRESHAALE